MHREQIVDAFWPELGPAAGGANLRKAVYMARRALGTDQALRRDGEMVVLWPEGEIRVDVEEFERAAHNALQSGDAERAGRVADACAGELLPEDRYTDWAEEPRDRLRQLQLRLLRLAGRWDLVLDLDRTDEEAHRALMRRYLEAGDRPAAMQQFDRLRRALHADLGVGPDPETVALYEEILFAEGEEPPSPAERVRGLLARGILAWTRTDLDEALRAAEQARALALEAGLGREMGEASGLLGMVCHAQGKWRDLFRSEFIDVRNRPDLAGFVLDAHLCLAEYSLYEPGGPQEAASFARELLEASGGSNRGTAIARLMLGEAELVSGALPEAESDLSSAEELYRREGAGSGLALSLERLAEAAVARRAGRTRAARLLREALPLARGSPLAPHLVVRVYGAMVQREVDPSGARAVVHRAERELDWKQVCQLCSIGYLVAATVAQARAGDTQAGRRSLDAAERVSGMWPGGPWQAAAWEARAELRLAEGAPIQASGLFREAAARFAVTGRPIDEARCRDSAAVAFSRGPPDGNAPGTPPP